MKYSIVELIQLGKYIGSEMAAVGVAGSGVGIGIILGGFIKIENTEKI